MIIWLAICIIVVPFGFVLLFGAPYLPTRKKQVYQALDLLNLTKGDTFVDLGSGDGAVIVEAAKRGYICYGYELNPLIWCISKLRTIRFGRQVHIYCKNFWHIPLPHNTKGVFVFLLDKYMIQLDKKLAEELPRGSRVVSYTFQIPHKKISKNIEALYLYRY